MEFSPATTEWFEGAFAGPTEAQRQGWESIGRGDHTLILAPTGSGKTLAAFLWALDRLLTTPGEGCRVLYVSPLKALTYDVARNLEAPLAGIAAAARRSGMELPELRIGTRTGDTPAEARRALARRPPDILVTTPESLYLLLTSRAAAMLSTVEHVIVDEIHAVAPTKRGSHLALSLERLEELTDRPPQRIGLSATQRPLEELARFLGGTRPVTVVDAGSRKPMELEVVVPAGGGGVDGSGSMWPEIYPELLRLIRAHRSTLVFVNSRRLAERLAARLNELAVEDTTFAVGASAYMGAGVPADLVRAHHGSIAREQRVEIEAALKAGTLPALVATSSLELGIDMGAVDLVVQVESPTSVSSGLQRVGRAGHQVGQPSKGRIFPKFRHDLLVSAVVAARMRSGLVEETRVPRNPLDVLAQQVVAAVAAADGPVPVDRLAAMVRRAYPYADLPDEAWTAVLDMLSGRYPSDEYGELRPRVVWDRVAGTLEARPGARMLAVTSGGTIPDRGLYGVFTPEGSRVGELDEEMVYESRPGDTFVLGATTWRVQEITRDRVVAVPAPGLPGRMPFWHGDAPGRPFELGGAIGEFVRTLEARSDAELVATCGLDERAVAGLRAYVAEERAATGGWVPTDRTIVVERFRDELGDWRVAVLTPFGARVHAPWALAIEARLRQRSGMECQALWSDDGIILRLPEAVDAPTLDAVLLEPGEIEDLVVDALSGAAMFAARFRENAARSLLLPRRRPGSRTPLWQLRQRAADLLGVASGHPGFPIILETYRECLQDVFDLPALTGLLSQIQAGSVQVAEVRLDAPSPFASGLVFAYVAQFMYDGDTPLAERRAQALTLDRRMLTELLGTDELRDLLDAEVIEAVEAELQGLAAARKAKTVEGVADLLRRLGDLSVSELEARCHPPAMAGQAVTALVGSGRAVPLTIAGEERLVMVEDAPRYRDGLGVVLPPGLPAALVEPVDQPLLQLVRRWARTHGPFETPAPARRFGSSPAATSAILDDLAAEGRVVGGGFRPGGEGRGEWCDADVLRTLRQRSLAALRREVEPVEADALVRFLADWQGVGGPQRAGLDRLVEVISQLEGAVLPADTFESDILAPRVDGYSSGLLDELLVGGEVLWVGAGSSGRDGGRIVLARRDHAPLLLPRLGYSGDPAPDLDGDLHHHIRAVLADRGACFFREMARAATSDAELLDALWELVWAGEVTCDGLAALRAAVGPAGRSRTRSSGRGSAGLPGRRLRPRPGSLRVGAPPRAQGRWSLVRRELGHAYDGGDRAGTQAGQAGTQAAVALASTLLQRHGVLTREAVGAEGLPGGFASIYPVLKTMEESGRIRRGYFLTGLGGAQFALPAALDQLRSLGSRPPAPVQVLAAADPANPFGAALPWPVKGPTRASGAFVVLAAGVASLFVERGGRALIALRPADGAWEPAAAGALAEMIRSGRWRRLVVQKYPDELVAPLLAAGFVPGPKGLVLYS